MKKNEHIRDHSVAHLRMPGLYRMPCDNMIAQPSETTAGDVRDGIRETRRAGIPQENKMRIELHRTFQSNGARE